MELKVQIGDKVKNFIASAVNKNEIIEKFNLYSIKSKYIVLYFYPRDLTPGCTIQAENLTQYSKELENYDITVLGISKDSIESHQKFIDKKKINYTLISDDKTTICEDFGVFGEKKFMGKVFDGIKRTTFILNSEFEVISIIDKPKVKEHTQEILEIINSK